MANKIPALHGTLLQQIPNLFQQHFLLLGIGISDGGGGGFNFPLMGIGMILLVYGGIFVLYPKRKKSA